MNSRERILKAFDHEEGDQVPTFVQSIMPKFYQAMETRYEDEVEDEDVILLGKDFTLIKKMGFDMSWGANLQTHNYDTSITTAYPLPNPGTNHMIERTGRITQTGILNGHFQSWVDGSILKTVEEAEQWYQRYIQPPEIEIPSAVEKVNSFLRSVLGTSGKFVPAVGFGSIFETLHEGLGPVLFAKMTRKHKPLLKKFAQWLANHEVARAKIAIETDYEIFYLADDSAYKNRSMISPELHMELIIPYYKQVCDVIRKAGKLIFFHSDGYITPYFPGLIEAGFNGVESMEPMAGNDLRYLKETYGDKLTLIGNVDVSQILPLGTPADVVKDVKRCIQSAAKGGGFILSPCTDLTDAVPLENGLAMLEAVKKYGKYPINWN
jgi:uroporphyrinogen-III decarboxylase